MAMVNLKRPKRTKKELKEEAMQVETEQDRYPWGTRLDFHEDEIDKIGTLQGMEGGEEIVIRAKGKVIQVSTIMREGSKKREHVEIQITDIGIEDANSAEEAFKAESK